MKIKLLILATLSFNIAFSTDKLPLNLKLDIQQLEQEINNTYFQCSACRNFIKVQTLESIKQHEDSCYKKPNKMSIEFLLNKQEQK